MTRINANIPVEMLNDRHLLAEHLDLKCRLKINKFDDIPSQFYVIKNNISLNIIDASLTINNCFKGPEV